MVSRGRRDLREGADAGIVRASTRPSQLSPARGPDMPANTKRVFYVTYVAHPIFTQILGARPDVRLDKLENESTDATVAPILAAAHAFQIGAARDELAATYHVTKSFLARTPNLLIVSSNGAGYDTVDVKACTEAGVLVVNQSGGNRHSVAEHVLAMLLDAVEAHHRDRPRHAPRGRHEPQHLHWQRSAGQDHRHRRARQRGEPRGGALPRPVRHAGAGLRPLPLRRGGRAARRQEGRARYADGARPTSCRSTVRSPRRPAA